MRLRSLLVAYWARSNRTSQMLPSGMDTSKLTK